MINEKFKLAVNNPYKIYFQRMYTEMQHSYPKEFKALILLAEQPTMKSATIRKRVGVDKDQMSTIYQFYNFLKILSNKNTNILNPNEKRIINNYLYTWFVNIPKDYKNNKEETKNNMKTETTKQKRKYTRITKEIVICVKKKLDKGYTYNEIVESTGISIGSIIRIKNGKLDNLAYGLDKESNNKEGIELDKDGIKILIDYIDTYDSIDETTNINIKKENTSINNSKDNYSRTSTTYYPGYMTREYNERKLLNTYFNAGLVKDRHNLPTDTYVYSRSFYNNEIFDYSYLYNKALEFMKNNILDENNKPTAILRLYATGCQSALAAVIKVCLNYNIGLDIMHWDCTTNLYTCQKMFDGNSYLNTRFLNKYSDEIYIYGCESNELFNSKEFYECRLGVPSTNKDKKTIYSESTLCNSREKIIEFYGKIVFDMSSSDKPEFIEINTYKKLENGEFIYDRKLLYTNNYDKKLN